MPSPGDKRQPITFAQPSEKKEKFLTLNADQLELEAKEKLDIIKRMILARDWKTGQGGVLVKDLKTGRILHVPQNVADQLSRMKTADEKSATAIQKGEKSYAHIAAVIDVIDIARKASDQWSLTRDRSTQEYYDYVKGLSAQDFLAVDQNLGAVRTVDVESNSTAPSTTPATSETLESNTSDSMVRKVSKDATDLKEEAEKFSKEDIKADIKSFENTIAHHVKTTSEDIDSYEKIAAHFRLGMEVSVKSVENMMQAFAGIRKLAEEQKNQEKVSGSKPIDLVGLDFLEKTFTERIAKATSVEEMNLYIESFKISLEAITTSYAARSSNDFERERGEKLRRYGRAIDKSLTAYCNVHSNLRESLDTQYSTLIISAISAAITAAIAPGLGHLPLSATQATLTSGDISGARKLHGAITPEYDPKWYQDEKQKPFLERTLTSIIQGIKANKLSIGFAVAGAVTSIIFPPAALGIVAAGGVHSAYRQASKLSDQFAATDATNRRLAQHQQELDNWRLSLVSGNTTKMIGMLLSRDSALSTEKNNDMKEFIRGDIDTLKKMLEDFKHHLSDEKTTTQTAEKDSTVTKSPPEALQQEENRQTPKLR